MAVRPVTASSPTVGSERIRNVNIYQWTALKGDTLDTGLPVESAQLADRSVHIEGALGTGGVVVIEGSNDGVNFVTLTDPLGNALSFNAVGRIKTIMEAVAYIRPRVSAGDAATSFTVTLLVRG